ncbi:zf-TFIIB domain-containing protein [Desulfotomaculum copahuensis]|uniref:Transcription factor zinc-finger domain-containing protein n=1 Tax=Desulfotomaculum copahuensis TaxID=1838280 RepID=A0A1B7LCY2_9FIRM|nr:zf-TFIIB domain-containing protein [Desulfotomaculum copahuensis]OAT80788.1 hypothetical protein A6M21_12635 [Desulfotomaculum copahuensis]
MKDCPVCNRPLKEVPRYGVMLDVCPACRGIWLDGGELEKIVKMAREFQDDFPPGHGYSGEYDHDDDHDHDHDHDDYRYRKHEYYQDQHYPHKKKKKGLFGIFEDIFD